MKLLTKNMPSLLLRTPRSTKGFTLIEIMITVAILAIIVAIALPSYRRYVIETNRGEAKAVLMQTAQSFERCFTRFSTYNDGNCGIAGQTTPFASETDKYNVNFTTLTATTFVLTATPVQADPECGNFTLDHRGQRGISGTGMVDDCW